MRFFGKQKRVLLYLVFSISFIGTAFAQQVDAQKQSIYSKLKDRRCTEMSLDKCDCSDAREMKAYIDALLETGVAKDEIFYKVAKKFSLTSIIDKQIKTEVEKRLIIEAGDKRPQLILETASLNLGQTSKKRGKINSTIKLYNKGNIDLIVSNLRVSCGCTSVSLAVGKNKSLYFGVAGASSGWQEIIKPGKFGELEIVLDLNHASMTVGKQTREVFISSTDPVYPESKLTVTVEVKE